MLTYLLYFDVLTVFFVKIPLQTKTILLKTRILFFIFLYLLNTNLVVSQEWKNLKSYQKETHQSLLTEGCWLKKNRKQRDSVWIKANKFNLSTENGNLKYKTISQMRDLYMWFDSEREKQGHDIKWIKTAGMVADQLSKLDCGFIRIFVVRNKEVVTFSNEGSQKVFAFAFSQLKDLYFSDVILKGTVAKDWDKTYGMKEQCEILEPLYEKLSEKALWKLDRMAKGKGFFALGISKEWKFVGSIKDCEARFEHGMSKNN